MSKEIAAKTENRPPVVLETGSGVIANYLDPGRMGQMMKLAHMLADSELLPDHFRGKPANCMIAVNMALRLRTDLFETAQQITIVYGRPTMSARWQLARLNNSGLLKGRLKYEWSGEDNLKTLACVAHGVLKSDGSEIRGSKVSYRMAEEAGWVTRKGSWWQKNPRHMLMLRAATFFIGEYFPETTCGFVDTETARDVDQTVVSPYSRREPMEVPSDAEPSPEAPLPNQGEPVGNPAERAASIAAKDWTEAKGRKYSVSKPVAAPLDPGAAVVVDEAGDDELSKMELE